MMTQTSQAVPVSVKCAAIEKWLVPFDLINMLKNESIDFQFEILFDWWREHGQRKCSFCYFIWLTTGSCANCPLATKDEKCQPAWHTLFKVSFDCGDIAHTPADTKRKFIQTMRTCVPKMLEVIDAVETKDCTKVEEGEGD